MLKASFRPVALRCWRGAAPARAQKGVCWISDGRVGHPATSAVSNADRVKQKGQKGRGPLVTTDDPGSDISYAELRFLIDY